MINQGPSSESGLSGMTGGSSTFSGSASAVAISFEFESVSGTEIFDEDSSLNFDSGCDPQLILLNTTKTTKDNRNICFISTSISNFIIA